VYSRSEGFEIYVVAQGKTKEIGGEICLFEIVCVLVDNVFDVVDPSSEQ